jgi:Asp/Glu/hydantoin racemase
VLRIDINTLFDRLSGITTTATQIALSKITKNAKIDLVSTTNENRDGSTITMIPQQVLMLNKSDDVSQRAAIGLSSGIVNLEASEKITIGTLSLSHFVNVHANKTEISVINGIKMYISYDDAGIQFSNINDSKFAFLNWSSQ